MAHVLKNCPKVASFSMFQLGLFCSVEKTGTGWSLQRFLLDVHQDFWGNDPI